MSTVGFETKSREKELEGPATEVTRRMAPWEGAAFSAGVRPQDLEEGERQDDNPLEPEVPEDLSGQVEHLQALMERSEGGDGGFSERPKATVMRNPTINK